MSGRHRILSVVGCGGNRDKGKRPMMTREALLGSDDVILTSDNPRFEKPGDILKDMMEGIEEEDAKRILIIEDREQAIRTACRMATAGDIVLVAGKGHEDYQEIEGVKHPFNDKEILKKTFNK